MNNEKIKGIEDFSKGMWLNYDCKVAKEIPNRQFLMIKTSHANSILNGEKDAVEKYVGFLKSGGSDYPIEILKKAGVDMTTSKPLEATINRFNELLDMLEKEI